MPSNPIWKNTMSCCWKIMVRWRFGSDVITAFYRMESLELWAKITINAVILGGSNDISRENIQKLIDLRGFYRVTGRHPGYKKFDNGLR